MVGRRRKSIEPPLSKVGIVLLNEVPALSASVTSNALGCRVLPEE
jgi:hypothetical protein